MKRGLPATCTAKTARLRACRTSRTGTTRRLPRKGRTGRTIPTSTSATWWTARLPATAISISGPPGRFRWKSAEPEQGSLLSGTAGEAVRFPVSRSRRRRDGHASPQCSLLKPANIPSISLMKVPAVWTSNPSGLTGKRRQAPQRITENCTCRRRRRSGRGTSQRTGDAPRRESQRNRPRYRR